MIHVIRVFLGVPFDINVAPRTESHRLINNSINIIIIIIIIIMILLLLLMIIIIIITITIIIVIIQGQSLARSSPDVKAGRALYARSVPFALSAAASGFPSICQSPPRLVVLRSAAMIVICVRLRNVLRSRRVIAGRVACARACVRACVRAHVMLFCLFARLEGHEDRERHLCP